MTHLRYWLPRLTLYFAPFVLITFGIIGLAVYSGEAMPLWMVHEIQEGDNRVVYRLRGNDTTMAYKLMGVERQRPAVLIVGSSRVLRFRRGFFIPSRDSFYNAGMNGMRLPEAAALLERLTPESAPRILIFGIDPYWFNGDRTPEPPATITLYGDLTPELWFRLTRRFAQEMLGGRISMMDVLRSESPLNGARVLGLGALRDGYGYLNDGSRSTKREALKPEEMQAALLDNDQIVRALEPGVTISHGALADVEALIQRADDLNITFVGVILPLAPSVYAEIADSPEHSYLSQARAELAALFARHGHPYLDLTNPALLNVDPIDMADRVHASDRLSAQILLEIAAAVPELAEYVDREALSAMIEAAAGPYDLFAVP
jgi:hypothetical protein